MLGLHLSIARVTLVIVSALVMIAIAKIRKDGRMGNQFYAVLMMFWSVVIVVTLRPEILDDIVNVTGLYNKAQFLLILSIGIIVYLLAMQVVKNNSVTFNLHRVVREIAIANLKKDVANSTGKLDIVIIIVARNEAKTIGNVIENIKSIKIPYSYKILVVNDGSTDGTELVAREGGALVVSHIYNLGIGGATKTGYVAAAIFKPEITISIDGDGQQDPAYIPAIISVIKDQKADLVYGSRFFAGNKYKTSTVRSIGNKFYTNLVNRLCKISITDVNTGYRGLRFEKLDSIFFNAETNFAIELALRAGKNRLKISEIPVKDKGRKHGQSQFHRLEKFLIYNVNAMRQIYNAYFRKSHLDYYLGMSKHQLTQ